MNSISKKTKLKLYRVIANEISGIQLLFQRDQFLDFLNDIWDLKAMPSTDDRFDNAEKDIIQHMFNNDDWEIDYLFHERLDLLTNDERFNIFIELIVSPKYREDENEIFTYVQYIIPHLKTEGLTLRIDSYNDEGYPNYTIHQYKEEFDLPNDVKQNDIPFLVKHDKYAILREHHYSALIDFPCFILVYNSGWNDYSIKTSFILHYLKSSNEIKNFGEIKITSDFDEPIIEVLPEEFTSLDNHFCSLGQGIEFYEQLKDEFDKDFLGILYSLRDAAFIEKVLDKFSKDKRFNTSLIRYNEAERLLREAKFIINDSNIEDFYNFKYLFKPKYSSDEIEVNFDFDVESDFPNRINAVIGKNGTGKTQLITSLPVDIYKKQEQKFSPVRPLFSKLIAVSYSVFDRFELPNQNAEFNYVYCGLRKEDGKEYSEKGLVNRFHSSWKKISSLERMPQWRRILLNFIDEDLLDEFIILTENEEKFTVDIAKFQEIRSMLSSGQSIILYILTEIVANIRYDTLLLYDEPETHLHPNAISQLVNTIYQLVEEFESYCIIATHSPLIIRELPSKSVFIIERENSTASIRKIGIESFGENLTTLTEEVFGNREVNKQYKKIIDDLVAKHDSFETIVSLIESDELPLSLNARLYIKGMLNKK